MRNITVSLDDELYRKARVAAAEADTSVTALVREFFTLLTGPSDRETRKTATDATTSLATSSILEVVDKVRQRHPRFDPDNPLGRDEVHAR